MCLVIVRSERELGARRDACFASVLPLYRRCRCGWVDHRGPAGGGMPRSLQIFVASLKAISRCLGTAVDRSASRPQKLWLPPSRRRRTP
jgi:hypothetical protein